MPVNKIDVRQTALALLEHAKRALPDEHITMEVSLLAGPPGFICRIMLDADCPIVILVPLTDYYKSSTRTKFILEVLPIDVICQEYDRLLDDAFAYGALRHESPQPTGRGHQLPGPI